MSRSNHNIASATTKNDFLNKTDSPVFLPTHDLLQIKTHLLEHVQQVGNLLQHIDPNSNLINDLYIDLKHLIQNYAVETEGRFIFPDSYPNPHLLIDYLNKYFTLKLLEDRRSGLTKQLTTMKILEEEVRVFLIDCFFVWYCFY
jgi:hypothetical protein